MRHALSQPQWQVGLADVLADADVLEPLLLAVRRRKVSLEEGGVHKRRHLVAGQQMPSETAELRPRAEEVGAPLLDGPEPVAVVAGELTEGVLVVVALFARPIEESRFEAKEVGASLYVFEQAVESLTALGGFGRGEERDELPAKRIHFIRRDFAAEGPVNEAGACLGCGCGRGAVRSAARCRRRVDARLRAGSRFCRNGSLGRFCGTR